MFSHAYHLSCAAYFWMGLAHHLLCHSDWLFPLYLVVFNFFKKLPCIAALFCQHLIFFVCFVSQQKALQWISRLHYKCTWLSYKNLLINFQNLMHSVTKLKPRHVTELNWKSPHLRDGPRVGVGQLPSKHSVQRKLLTKNRATGATWKNRVTAFCFLILQAIAHQNRDTTLKRGKKFMSWKLTNHSAPKK